MTFKGDSRTGSGTIRQHTCHFILVVHCTLDRTISEILAIIAHVITIDLQ